MVIELLFQLQCPFYDYKIDLCIDYKELKKFKSNIEERIRID